VAFIKYCLDQDAARALQSLQGRNIYDGCCQLGIELLPVSFDTSGATNSAPGTKQVAAATEVLKQEEKVVPVQPSAVAAIAIAVDAANVTEAAGMQEKEASKAQQEPESVQTQ
jgi:hypothetical protein